MRKVLSVLVLIVLASLALANPPIGKRIAPKGTFTGDAAQLVAVGHSDSRFAAHYAEIFGLDWDKPGALKVGARIKIPDGALVPHNALINAQGKIVYADTYQRGEDFAFPVTNTLTGKTEIVKSCCQDCKLELPKKLGPTTYETDFTNLVTIGDVSAEAEATATATGGNAAASVVFPQPIWIPQIRSLGVQQGERYALGQVSWTPQTKNVVEISNVNNNTNINTLTQSQAQAQGIAVAIGA